MPTRKELAFVFSAIDADGGGTLSPTEILTWVLQVEPGMDAEARETLSQELQKRFGENEVTPEDFCGAFMDILKMVAGVRVPVLTEAAARKYASEDVIVDDDG